MVSRVSVMLTRIRPSVADAASLISPFGSTQRRIALWAIPRLGSAAAKDAIAGLVAIATDKKDEERIREEALQALRKFGPAAKAALPALLELVKKPGRGVGYAAVRAIQAIDPQLGRQVVKKWNETRPDCTPPIPEEGK